MFIVSDSIYLGWCICKFNAYKNYRESTKQIEKTLKDFEELMKMKENEPFKEFEENGKS